MKGNGVWWLLGGVAVLALIGRRFANVLRSQVVRNDAAGSGHYGSHRTGHVHEGVDLLVTEGEPVYSPVDGTVLRITNAYSDSDQWKGVVVDGEGYEWKLLYVLPVAGLHAGQVVHRGELVGTAQAITARYNDPGMRDHIHVEARTGGQVVNPEPLLSLA